MPSESIFVRPVRPIIAEIAVYAFTEKEDAHNVELLMSKSMIFHGLDTTFTIKAFSSYDSLLPFYSLYHRKGILQDAYLIHHEIRTYLYENLMRYIAFVHSL